MFTLVSVAVVSYTPPYNSKPLRSGSTRHLRVKEDNVKETETKIKTDAENEAHFAFLFVSACRNDGPE